MHPSGASQLGEINECICSSDLSTDEKFGHRLSATNFIRSRSKKHVYMPSANLRLPMYLFYDQFAQLAARYVDRETSVVAATRKIM